MKKIITAGLLLAIFVISVLISPATMADENVDIEIYIEGTEPRFHNDIPILVSGMWNILKVDMGSDKPRDLRVILFKGDEKPSEENISSYYEWRYDYNSGNHWKSMVEYNNFSYINTEKCKKTGNVYRFYIGISDILPNTPFYKEGWKVEIYENNNKVHSESFYLEKATKGIAHAHGDIIYFYVDPFKEMIAPGNDFFTFKNTGNVPLDISVTYPNLDFLIEFISFTDRINPQDKAEYHLSLHANSWEPQIITDIGEGIGKVPDNLILDDSKAFVFLKTAIAVNAADLRVFVGHSRHELVENLFGIGLSFQYEKSINMDEGEVRDVSAYISGDGRLSLSIWADGTDNIKILKILKEGEEINSPIDIHSTSSTEQKVTVRVEAIRERKSGNIYYELEALDGRSKTYRTHIDVNPLSGNKIDEIPGLQSDSSFGSNNILTMVVVILIFAALGYMIVSQLRNNRR